MKVSIAVIILMNILRLVAAEKEKKSRPNPEYQKLEKEAACNSKQRGEAPVKVDREELRQRLTPMEYHVTQERGTERPFSGKFLRMKDEGVYTCVVCDNPLFTSDQKYEAGCGWPSFHDVMAHGKVTLTKDTSHGMVRTEVMCARCGAHLGHVFDDGPPPTFTRYCINSAALKFKPATELNGNTCEEADVGTAEKSLVERSEETEREYRGTVLEKEADDSDGFEMEYNENDAENTMGEQYEKNLYSADQNHVVVGG